MNFSALFLKIQSGIISTICPSEELLNSCLLKVYVGQSKDNFSVVEKMHSVVEVFRLFGSFIKFVVTISLASSEEVPFGKRLRLDYSQQDLHNNVYNGGLPKQINGRTRKDELYNELVSCFSSMGVSWENPEQHGKAFITDMCNVLWYLDGHHAVLSSRSCSIPSFFSRFTGFNKPELSKHRKRSISNLSRDKID